mgnify:FL=1
MSAIQFPVSRIVPEADPTEMALHTLIDVTADFQKAIAEGGSVSRLLQVRSRIAACVDLLQQAEDAVLRKMNTL